MLDTAKLAALAAHLDRTTECYSQRAYEYCAMGHYFNHIANRGGSYIANVLMCATEVPSIALKEFGLTPEEGKELFGAEGCGGARTAKDAAAYINRFLVYKARTMEKQEFKMAA